MRGLERRDTLGMIDRSNIYDRYDSDGINEMGSDESDSSVKSYHSDQNQHSKSYSWIEFCVKTQIFTKEFRK